MSVDVYETSINTQIIKTGINTCLPLHGIPLARLLRCFICSVSCFRNGIDRPLLLRNVTASIVRCCFVTVSIVRCCFCRWSIFDDPWCCRSVLDGTSRALTTNSVYAYLDGISVCWMEFRWNFRVFDGIPKFRLFCDVCAMIARCPHNIYI